MPEAALAGEFLRVYESFYNSFPEWALDSEAAEKPEKESKKVETWKIKVEMVFLLSVVWSIGTKLDEGNQPMFTATLYKLCKEKFQRQSHG